MRRQLPLLRAHLRHALTVGLLNSGLPFALFAYALLSLPSGMTSILNATTPLGARWWPRCGWMIGCRACAWPGC
jgi:drug/metabolite transporter (DMT)-like permease